MIHFACLMAHMWRLAVDKSILYNDDKLKAVLDATVVPKFVPKKKNIITDENVSKEEAAKKMAEDEPGNFQLFFQFFWF